MFPVSMNKCSREDSDESLAFAWVDPPVAKSNLIKLGIAVYGYENTNK
jgi:hypothetical protein